MQARNHLEVYRLQGATIVPRCLLVDDDRDGREGFAEYLRAFGFETIECPDAESAWQCLTESTPDIVLLDLQLPRMSGWDLVQRLRATPRLASLPIAVFSARVFPEDRQRAEAVGCDVFITKPAAPADVLAELHKLLRSSRRKIRRDGTTNASSVHRED